MFRSLIFRAVTLFSLCLPVISYASFTSHEVPEEFPTVKAKDVAAKLQGNEPWIIAAKTALKVEEIDARLLSQKQRELAKEILAFLEKARPEDKPDNFKQTTTYKMAMKMLELSSKETKEEDLELLTVLTLRGDRNGSGGHYRGGGKDLGAKYHEPLPGCSFADEYIKRKCRILPKNLLWWYMLWGTDFDISDNEVNSLSVILNGFPWAKPLKNLNIGFNIMTCVNENPSTFHPEIGDLGESLEELILQYNHFHLLPENLAKLSKLRVLDLTGGKLLHTFVDWNYTYDSHAAPVIESLYHLVDLPSLEELYLGENWIFRLDERNDTNLQEVDTRRKKISGFLGFLDKLSAAHIKRPIKLTFLDFEKELSRMIMPHHMGRGDFLEYGIDFVYNTPFIPEKHLHKSGIPSERWPGIIFFSDFLIPDVEITSKVFEKAFTKTEMEELTPKSYPLIDILKLTIKHVEAESTELHNVLDQLLDQSYVKTG